MVAVSKHTSPMVDSDLLNKAIGALLKHHSNETSEKNSLLGNEESIQVQFTLNRVPEQTSARPIRIEIPHSFHQMKTNNDEEDTTAAAASSDGAEEVEACLFVKDESKAWVKEMIDKFPSHLSCIQKVITLTSLRKKYAQYKDRRELLKKYNLFLADDRILPMLGKSLGKNFFQEKKQPIPVKLTRAEAFPFTIQKCLSSTFMHISAGTCISIKAGNTSMPLNQIVENAAAIVLGAVGHIPRKWANVSAIHIKTSTSVALPVYNKTREELEEISRLAKKGEPTNSTTNKDPSKKRVRDNDEDDAAMDEMQTQEKKKKKELAKSPLAKALKKAKAESTLEKETKKEVSGTPVVKKKSKKSDETSKTLVSENVKYSKKTKASDASVEEKTPSSSAKKAKSEEKGKDFIASKKFKGAKKGYVFRKGKNGLGYYIDIKPVVDKMALDALARINKGGGNVKRRHSTGAKSGKSRGRRSL